jgi:hypothetical protein
MKRNTLLTATALLFICGTRLPASSLNLDYPYGPHTDPTVGFAFWDTFASTTFTNAAPTSTGSLLFAGLSQSTPGNGAGFGPFGGGESFYDASANPGVNWDLKATAAFEITSLTLQLKHSTPAGAPIATYFVPQFTYTDDGVSKTVTAGTPTVTATSESINGSTVSVLKWTWTGVSVDPGTQFTINYNRTAGGDKHVVTDAVALDAVPEPSTLLVAISGVATLGLVRRRRALS